MTIALAAGGTGGHVVPALVTATKITDTNLGTKVIIIGTGKELEKRLVSQYELTYETIQSTAFVGKGLKGFARFSFLFPVSFYQAVCILKKHNVRCIIGFGGYPSVIPVIAAWYLGIPRIIFEQNALAGKANIFLSKISNKIFAVAGCTGFKKKINAYITNPVRKEILEVTPWSLPKKGEALRILVTGGSQGAVSLNNAIIGCINLFRNHNCKIYHQTGSIDSDRILKIYEKHLPDSKVVPFIDDMKDAYSDAHLVICRAGAGSVAEILQTKRPAIFVPLAISNAHQEYNISDLISAGGAWSLPQNDDLGHNLKKLLEEVILNYDSLLEKVNSLKQYVDQLNIEEGSKVLANTALSLSKS
ncbi:MAG TPA: undecaprenyldiphospho-muramoylpentapeptide beta-N-acetylglucosaminyltransferase [Oligoflexia bacterium]|nr:undecaprenyldiphospho-muramoylpentapeptide beta-N-acetylglucosaminyltransferase [Oligoflexia bacterium]HMP47845.1 undecaprenyldiphospho-muramoylpentapeptide beta-N-acetylglucosaminyltransferase [Oligoflexia bacterium]